MVNPEFWEDWNRKTKLELSAIKSLKSAQQIILDNLPKEQIISVYVKGSFVRREMNQNSDVDILTIVKNSKWLKKLKELQQRYGNKYAPKLGFSGYSLWELKNNKKVKMGKADRPAPSRTVQHLEHYTLLSGVSLKKEDFHQGDDIKRLRTMINVFQEVFLPSYEEKKFGFSEVVKQTFWLVENEQKVKGKNPLYHWGKMANSIKDKNHIIHDALKFRKKSIKDKQERAKFIKKLTKYLSELKQLTV